MMILSKNSIRLVAASFMAQALAIGAMADPTTDQIEALKQQIQALTEKVEALEQAHNAETTKQTNAPFITAGADGFSLQSADGDFILKLSGFAQVDARDYLRSAPGGKDTFTIRR